MRKLLGAAIVSLSCASAFASEGVVPVDFSGKVEGHRVHRRETI